MKTCKQCNNTYSSDLFKIRIKLCEYCREQNKIKREETKKQWRLDNPEKVKEYQRKYREANVEQIKEMRRKYREKHLEQIKEKNRIYKQIEVDCEVCGWKVKKCRWSEHIKTATHKFNEEKMKEKAEVSKTEVA